MKSKLKNALRETGLILFLAVGVMSLLMIAAAPFWWYLPTDTVAWLMLLITAVLAVIFAAASFHSEFRLIVRIERRRK